MSKLEERQSEMRERMNRELQRRTEIRPSVPSQTREKAATPRAEDTDLRMLHKRIAALEAENARLRCENKHLRNQNIVYVEREKSPDEERREQQHNYFKYSNARRW